MTETRESFTVYVFVLLLFNFVIASVAFLIPAFMGGIIPWLIVILLGLGLGRMATAVLIKHKAAPGQMVWDGVVSSTSALFVFFALGTFIEKTSSLLQPARDVSTQVDIMNMFDPMGVAYILIASVLYIVSYNFWIIQHVYAIDKNKLEHYAIGILLWIVLFFFTRSIVHTLVGISW